MENILPYQISEQREKSMQAGVQARRIKKTNPRLPFTKIAKIVGVAPSTLYRSRWYKSQYARPLTDEQRKARNYRKDVAENFAKGGAGIVTSESIDNLPIDGRGSLKESPLPMNPSESFALNQFRSEIAQVIVQVTQTHEQLLTLLKRLV